jgi:hypothetical protein
MGHSPWSALPGKHADRLRRLVLAAMLVMVAATAWLLTRPTIAPPHRRPIVPPPPGAVALARPLSLDVPARAVAPPVIPPRREEPLPAARQAPPREELRDEEVPDERDPPGDGEPLEPEPATPP